MSDSSKPLTYQQELLRKLVHLSSLWVVVLYHFTNQDVMLNVLIPFTLVVLLVDGARRCSGDKCPMLETILGYILRNHEREKLSGASYLMVSALIMVLCFPKLVAMTAFTYLIVSDSAAALVGKAIGKRKFFGKTLEGCMAFFLSALGCMWVIKWFYDLGYSYVLAGAGAALVATCVEALSGKFKLDDNFTIPISAGLTMLSIQYVVG